GIPAVPDDARDGVGPGGGVRDEPASDGGAPDFELGLDEHDDVGSGCRNRCDGGEDQLEGDEGEVADDQVGRCSFAGDLGEVLAGHVADVVSLDVDDAGVAADGCRELPVSDVDGENF